jgi:hypothetical protein
MVMFNRNKPHATVHGVTKGAAYNQGGRYFNSSGREINFDTGEIIVDPNDPADATPVVHEPQPMNPADIDLVAWGKGDVEYLWADLQKTFKARYHREIGNKRDAVDTLIEVGALNPDQARKFE